MKIKKGVNEERRDRGMRSWKGRGKGVRRKRIRG